MCSRVLPVCVGSNLVDLWLGPRQELIHIGHVEEEVLHVDRRGRGFPCLKHTAALNQNKLLLRHKEKIDAHLIQLH